MRLRQSKLLKDPSRKLRWTVLPPQFYEDVCYTKDCLRAVDMAGKKEPYPPFWEVDYLYIPIWIKQEDWLLFRVDMFNMEITQYWTDKRWGNEKRRLVEHVMDIFPIFFKHFLDQIHYWRNSRYCTKKKVSFGYVQDGVPQDNGNIANSGVLVCMMMENLVRGKSLIDETDVEESCTNYRRHMANELYRWRCM